MPNEHSFYEEEVNSYFDKLPANSFVEVGCLLCSSQNFLTLFRKHTQHIVRCECGFVYNKNQPTVPALKNFYSSSQAMTSWSTLKTTEKELKKQKEKYSKAAMILANKSARLLDIGSGNGVFLEYMRQYNPGMILHGIEPNEDAYLISKSKGQWVVNQDFADFYEETQMTYDAITLWGCLEHLKFPVKTLKNVVNLLEPGGRLLACVPNVNSFVVRVLWEKCFTFCPQHLWHFDKYSLHRLFSSLGLEVEYFWTIESEAIPAIKGTFGFSPYEPLPAWANKKYLDSSIVSHYEKKIFSADEGYKIIIIGKKK